VIYSLTKDNTFLPPWYISRLKEIYDAKMVERLLNGKWIFITSDVIYYEYDREIHYSLENTKVDQQYPIGITFDFNIGAGKPMSCAIMQKIDDVYYVIDEIVLSGSRTVDVMEEFAGRGYLDLPENPAIDICGDATGRARDTRNNRSDYDIICDYLNRYRRKDNRPIKFNLEVPLSNPSLRNRHNIVNGRLKNSEGKVSIRIDRRCETVNEGFSSVKLVPGGKYVEDDSKKYQHITTAIGYYICKKEKQRRAGASVITF
jgi:hypothetical protein